MLRSVLVCMALLVPCMAQPPRAPDIEAQRAAMAKLGFLIGKWSGEARIFRGSGETLGVNPDRRSAIQAERVDPDDRGIGRSKSDGKPRCKRSESFLTMTMLVTTSKLESSNGSASASPSMKRAFRPSALARACARCIRFGAISTPVTCTPSRAAHSATCPEPQATSSSWHPAGISSCS